jgi:hypothetical protein
MASDWNGQVLPTVTNRTVLVLTVAVAAIGVVDAAVGRNWDLLTVFALVGLLQLVLLLRLSGRRPAVPLRADLVHWLRDRAEAEGESPDRVLDRAVSAYRAGLLGEEVDRPGRGGEQPSGSTASSSA